VTVRHRIRADQLQVRAPLPVDIYDASNRLLLRRGNVIATEAQLARLVGEGMFSDQPLPSRAKGASPRAGDDQGEDLVNGARTRSAAKPNISVYAEMAAAASTLGALLCAPESNPQFAADMEELAGSLRRAGPTCR